MSVFELLTETNDKPDPRFRLRKLPHQPDSLPSGKVFVGIDLGFLNYEGARPKAGDLVLISGQSAQRIAQAPNTDPLRSPLFPPDCVCKCPPKAGTAFYLAFIRHTPVIHALDATTAALLQLIGRQELGYHTFGFQDTEAALAVDPEAPHHLYVLDNRRDQRTIRTDTDPVVQRGYFGIATFVLTGGQYIFSAYAGLTDPYGGTTFPPAVEPDPPAIPGNCLSVSSGLPVVTMKNSPARYQSLSAGVFTTHTLTQNGTPLALGLRGNIVTVPDRPANKHHRYVLATADDATFSLVRFNAVTDVVGKVFALTLPARGVQLAAVCNRLLILSATLDTLGGS